jgi:signal transduction histidine kinase
MEEALRVGDRPKSGVWRYGVAATAVAAASIGNALLAKWGYTGFAPLLFAGVMFSAWYGGIGPGLFATVLATFVAAWQFPLSLTNRQEWDDTLRLSVFAASATITSGLHALSRRTEHVARIARHNAEECSAAKDRFLAMISHELRTPLTPVLMTVELLARDSRIPNELHRDLDIIRQSVGLESRLIDDLLDLARIGSGKMRLDLELVDAREVIACAVDVLKHDITEKRLSVGSDLDPGDCTVLGDRLRLQQVFWNLLRNAVKFTPAEGNINIRVRRQDNQVIVDVSDTGIGIEPDRLAVIFEAFAQGGDEITARFGGLGLGLAIAKSLVAAHRGSIVASSRGRGLGAMFRLKLPAAAAKPSSEVAPQKAAVYLQP